MMADLSHLEETTKLIRQYAGKTLTLNMIGALNGHLSKLDFYVETAYETGNLTLALYNEYQAFMNHVCECIRDSENNILKEVVIC